MSSDISDIGSIREQINSLDEKIVGLLNERAKLALELGRIKATLGQKTYDPIREGAVIANIDRLNKGPLPKGSIEDIYRSIMTACREIQIT
ncbi:MAG TPA: chorismate mutase [Candidatus Saccharimonadales bacterium]|nr:chorismate mutase [Candidatus Saccharimonadales bacterium]